MFNRNSLKLGLTGAVLFIIMGSFTACSDEGPTAPPTAQQDQAGVCTMINGVMICV